MAELDEWLIHLLAAGPEGPHAPPLLGVLPDDWRRLCLRAALHGVVGPLAQILNQPGTTCPPTVLRDLDLRRTAQRLWQSLLTDTLFCSIKALEDVGVRVVSLKGPILAERLYGDRCARFSSDVDLLVSVPTLPVALTALTSLGYAASDSPPTARYLLRHHHHLTMTRSGGPRLELHFRAHAGFGVVIEADDLLRRSIPYRTGTGETCWVLAPEDEFLFLAVHAAEHCFDRLVWLLDLQRFVSAYPSLDWPVVWQRARDWRVVRAAAVSARLVRRLGVRPPCPESTAGRWRSFLALQDLLGSCRGSPPWDTPAALLLQAVLCDRPGLAARHLFHHLGRICRRRLWRLLPRCLPPDWQA